MRNYGVEIDIKENKIYVGGYVIELVKPYVLDYRLTLDGEIYTYREQLEYRVRTAKFRGDHETTYTKRQLEGIIDCHLGRNHKRE